jgi:hypothetical protein
LLLEIGHLLERVWNFINRLRAANFVLHFAKIFICSAATDKNLWLVQNEIFSLSLDHDNPNTLLEPKCCSQENGAERKNFAEGAIIMGIII